MMAQARIGTVVPGSRELIEVILTLRGSRVEIKGDREEEGPRADLSLDPLRRDTIRVLERLVGQGKLEGNRRALEVLGRHLFEAVFSDGVRGFFENKLAKVPKGERLRIQLKFEEDAEDLASLPWEYMYYVPKHGPAFFLSTHAKLILSRFLPTQNPREQGEPPESPLSVLVAVSNPNDPTLGPVVAEPVIEAIATLKDTLRQENGGREAMLIDRLDNPTVESFTNALESEPHVLHFIGHGQFDHREKQGKVALLAPDGVKPWWCIDKDFAGYMQRTEPPPRLVFLHLCEGGVAEFEESFAGLAPKLILEGVQAVVAMQYRIFNKHAISFAKAFYKKLASGSDVDEAVQDGRNQIALDHEESYSSRGFGTPVLYMHARDSIIRPLRDRHTRSSQEAAGNVERSSRVGAGGGRIEPTGIVAEAVEAPVAAAFTPLDQADEPPGEDEPRSIRSIRDTALFEFARAQVDLDAARKEIDDIFSNRTLFQVRAELGRRINGDSLSGRLPIWRAVAEEIQKVIDRQTQ